MRMFYQPVMNLLQNGGRACTSDIAKALLVRDPTQVSYYEEITKRMPGRVLTQNRGITERERDTYYLKDFNELSSKEVNQLIDQSRLGPVFGCKTDRRKSSGYISGTLRYEVFKRAKRRCERGIHDYQKALEVDHIVPRNLGGADMNRHYAIPATP